MRWTRGNSSSALPCSVRRTMPSSLAPRRYTRAAEPPPARQGNHRRHTEHGPFLRTASATIADHVNVLGYVTAADRSLATVTIPSRSTVAADRVSGSFLTSPPGSFCKLEEAGPTERPRRAWVRAAAASRGSRGCRSGPSGTSAAQDRQVRRSWWARRRPRTPAVRRSSRRSRRRGRVIGQRGSASASVRWPVRRVRRAGRGAPSSPDRSRSAHGPAASRPAARARRDGVRAA